MTQRSALVIPGNEAAHAITDAIGRLRVESAVSAARMLDRLTHVPEMNSIYGDFGQAQAFILSITRDFWITATLRGARASVTLGPDYNGPANARLEHLIPVEIGDSGWTVEILQESGTATEQDLCVAALVAMLEALTAIMAHAKTRAAISIAVPENRIAALEGLYEELLDPGPDTAKISTRLYAAIFGRVEAKGNYLEHLADARELVREALPGYWMTTGLCSLSGHASIGPLVPAEGEPSSYDEDIHPGEGSATVNDTCTALLRCLIEATLARLRAEA